MKRVNVQVRSRRPQLLRTCRADVEFCGDEGRAFVRRVLPSGEQDDDCGLSGRIAPSWRTRRGLARIVAAIRLLVVTPRTGDRGAISDADAADVSARCDNSGSQRSPSNAGQV
jgi:hypothetical protein